MQLPEKLEGHFGRESFMVIGWSLIFEGHVRGIGDFWDLFLITFFPVEQNYRGQQVGVGALLMSRYVFDKSNFFPDGMALFLL